MAAEWLNWLEDEIQLAAAQNVDPNLGLVVNVERTGYIKRRSQGVPNWKQLAEFSKKINCQKYGMPDFFQDTDPVPK